MLGGLAYAAATGVLFAIFWLMVRNSTLEACERLVPQDRLVLILPLMMGTIGFFRRGGYALVQHTVLRLVLSRNGGMPVRLSHFLNFACHCALLRQAGGGYLFLHTMLRDHLASECDRRMLGPPAPPSRADRRLDPCRADAGHHRH